MAQTGSAQREPSMEEILASIRRIIQDSDPVQQPADGEPGMIAPEMDAGTLPEGRNLREVEAFRAELEEPAPAVSGPAFSGAAAAPEPEEVVIPSAPYSDVTGLRAQEIYDAEPQPVFDAVEAVDAAAVPSLPEEEAAFVPMDAPELASDADTTEQRPAIISDHAGRQVAAAFGELSEAFAASRRRSFDDMAQEMLRPMLQEWLDNNLPTLVERLVREEIERVARGG